MMRAWLVTCAGIRVVSFAERRGRAEYRVAFMATDAGFFDTVGEAFIDCTTVRAQQLDGKLDTEGVRNVEDFGETSYGL